MGTWRSLLLRLVLTAPTYSLREVYHAFTDVLFLPQHLYEEVLAFDAQRLLTTFAVPCFIFQGDSDVFSPPALVQQHIATVAAPTKALVLLKSGGHLALLLQPEQFLEELLTYVRPLVIPQTSTNSLDAGRTDEYRLPMRAWKAPYSPRALPESGGEAR
jgi:pimeloyl-ACP methyl ester carboxylesterase